MPIDPVVHGSRSGEFALRNLHKSPELAGRGASDQQLASHLQRYAPCSDLRRFRAAGRRPNALSTCRRTRAAGASEQRCAGRHTGRRPRTLAGQRPARGGRVGKIAFRAHFLRFVARAHHFFALFGPSLPASNYYPNAHQFPDLRLYRAPSSTGALRASPGRPSLQRTSKNVHELASRRRACNEPQKMCIWTLARRARRATGAGRRPRTPARPPVPREPAGARRQRTPTGCGRHAGRASAESGFVHVFSVCCAIAHRFGPLRGRSGRLQRLPSYKSFHHRSSDLRFCSEAPEAGHLERVRIRNKPQKMCRQRPTPPPGSAPACGPLTRGRPQGERASDPRPAVRNLHQSPPFDTRPQPECPSWTQRGNNRRVLAICVGFVRRTRRSTNHKQTGRWTYMSIGP